MLKVINKIFVNFLVVFGVFLFFVFIFIPLLKAATIEEIRVKNSELPLVFKQPEIINQSLSNSINKPIFTKTLKIGSIGKEVKKLQQVLGVELSDIFNSNTEMAVKNFQLKNKLKSDGLVGLKTRTKLNSLFSGKKQVKEALSVLPNNLTISLAQDNPLAGQLLSDGVNNVAGSQSLAHILSLKLETLYSAEIVKIFSLKLRKIGNISDSEIENVYLYEQGGTRLIARGELSSGIVTFSDSKALFTVAGSKVIWAMVDLNKDALSKQAIGFSINPVIDIVSDIKDLLTGFNLVNNNPLISGNLMNIMAVSDLGRLIITSQPMDNLLESNNNELELLRLQLSVFNQDIELQSLTIHQIGDRLDKNSINFKLYDGDVAIHQTLGVLDNKGGFTFDFYKFPLIIKSDSKKNLSIRAVLGDSSNNIKLTIMKTTDIIATDANYGIGVSPDNGIIGTFSPIK